MKKNSRNILALSLLFTLFLPHNSEARSRAGVKQQTIRAENKRPNKEEKLILPYAFSTDSMGTVAGVGAAIKGWYQPQLIMAGSVFGGLTDDTYGFILGAWDYQLPWAKRVFASAFGSYGHYPNQRAYASTPRPAGTPRPGSNDSNKDDYIEAKGENNWLDLRLEYVLPIGAASDDPIMTYHTKNGMLQGRGSGGESWNPLTGGVTTLVLRQFNQTETFDTATGDYERTIHPIEIGIGYNNTDYPTNPSTGSSQYFDIKHDFGWGDATTWTFIEFEASKYFSLGESKHARQRVVALNFWTGDAPSWDETTNSDGTISIDGNPPQYEGATLGGFYRMRAYPSRRFHDRSVIYSTAEFRYTPRWNPVQDVSWLSWLSMDWWQLVGFVEGGRVADEYSASELFSDWKVDGGVGIRAFLATGVIRFDIASSDEGTAMWFMFNQPF